MSAENPRLQSLFEAAIAIDDDAERTAYLDQECGSDVELRQRLEQLLASDELAGSFMEKPPAELDATVASDAPNDRRAAFNAGLAAGLTEDEAILAGKTGHSVLKQLGQTVDVPQVMLHDEAQRFAAPVERPDSAEIPDRNTDSRYQIQGEIARGGMGAILKSRDNDLGRELAIKILLDEHKTRPEVIQRFIEEAQIGGQLQHPGIAPVYDFGQFSDRRPFFAMKLVKGETLAKLLGDRKSTADDRGRFLSIFEHICQTMAYAHSRGVIHRDLKPANIMVGAFGEVQVMDWGLAKVLAKGGVADEKRTRDRNKHSAVRTNRSSGDLDSSVGSVGSQTQMGSVMGTPAYMPPEQALGEIDLLDQRADVFGLGAILCEILTGQPPYVADDGTQVFRLASRGKLDDAFMRLDACSADAEVVALAKECLAADAANRPNDAAVLAERVTSYLESVESRLQQTELERASEATRVLEQKKRLRITLILAASILVVLSVGIAATAWQAHQTEQARVAEAERAEGERLAKLEAQKQEQLASNRAAQLEKGNRIINSIFADLDIGQVRQDDEPLEAVLGKRLVKAAELIDDEAIGDPLVVAQLQLALGESLVSLGFLPEALELFSKSRATRESILGKDHPDTLKSMVHLADAYNSTGHLENALPLFDETLKLALTHLGHAHLDTLIIKVGRSRALKEAGDFKKAVASLEETLKLFKAEHGSEHRQTLVTMNNLADAYYSAGRMKEAVSVHRETLALRRETIGPTHPETISSVNNLAMSLLRLGQVSEAVSLLEKTLELSRAKMGADHPQVLATRTNLGNAHREAGRLKKAIEILEAVVPRKQSKLGEDHPLTLTAMGNLCTAYAAAGLERKAIQLAEVTLKLKTSKYGPRHPKTLPTVGDLAKLYLETGKTRKAFELFEATVKASTSKLGPDHPDTLTYSINRANAYRVIGDLQKAIPLCEKVAKATSSKLGHDHPNTLAAMNNLAGCYQAAGQPSKALPIFVKTLEIHEAKYGLAFPATLVLRNNLALTYIRAGQAERALSMLTKVVEDTKTKLGPDHRQTLMSRHNLISAHEASGDWAKAASMSEQLLKRMTTVFGPDDADTLTIKNNLATNYWRLGQLDKSIPLYEETLAARERILGKEHLTTIGTRGNLGVNLRDAGQVAESLPHLQEAYRAAQNHKEHRWIGRELLKTLVTMRNAPAAIGLARELLDDARKRVPKESPELASELAFLSVAIITIPSVAEPMLRECVEIRQKTMPDSWLLLETQSVFGRSLSDQQKYEEAEPLLRVAYREMRKRAATVSEKQGVSKALVRLGALYRATGRQQQQMKLYEDEFRFNKEKHGPSDPHTLGSMSRAAGSYWRMNQLDKSIPLFEEHLRLQRKVHGENHMETLRAMANLGVNYNDAGRTAEGLPLLEKAHSATKSDPQMNWIAEQLMNGYRQAGEFKKASSLVSEYLASMRKTLPANSIQLSSQLAQASNIYLKADMYTDAEPLLRECLTIREKLMADHWLLFNTYSFLGGALLGQKRYKEAEPLLLKGCQGIQQRVDDVPPQGRARIVESFQRLIKLYRETGNDKEAAKWQAELDDFETR